MRTDRRSLGLSSRTPGQPERRMSIMRYRKQHTIGRVVTGRAADGWGTIALRGAAGRWAMVLGVLVIGVLLGGVLPALADNLCKPATGPQSKCTQDEQCCTGLVCDVNGSTDGFKHCQPGCHIGGTFYGRGTVDSTQCQSCQPSVSTTAWTALPDNTSCNDGNACTRTDTCQSGQCV